MIGDYSVYYCNVPRLDQYKINYERRKVGGKWKPLVMFILYVKPCRFNKVKQLLPDISSTQLSKAMRELENDKIVERVGELYRLSNAGQRIVALMNEIKSVLESISH